MSRTSLACSAFMLIVVAGVAIFANDQPPVPLQVESKKIVIDPDAAVDSKVKLEALRLRLAAGRSPRVLFITANGCDNCAKEMERLSKTGGDFELMRARGWRIGKENSNHVQIVDREEFPEVVELLRVRQFPTVACLENGEIVRSFTEGCTTPLDVWTFGWLLKGQNERPASSIPEAARVEDTGHYRLRGNHWTVEGNPNPSKELVLAHLRGANHGHAAPAYGALETWSFEELRSLHDDLHEREGGTIGNYVNYASSGPIAANRSLDAFSGSRKAFGK